MQWFGWLRRGRGQRASADAGSGSSTVVLGGRERAVGVPYALPRDLEEANRLDFQHYILRNAFQGNYAAPISNPSSILDVGTGTGRWAIEMAQFFPQARVIGMDVMQPKVDAAAERSPDFDVRPSNYQFVPGNVLEGLPFPDASFDFVHQRLLFLAIPADRWPFVISEMVRVTRLGGWVELVETTAPRGGGPAVDQLFTWGSQLVAHRGVDTNLGTAIGSMLQKAAGVGNVSAREIEIPFGAWGGRIGNLLAMDLLFAVEGVGGLVVTQGLASEAQFKQTLAAARADANGNQYHCISPFYIAYGQRVS